MLSFIKVFNIIKLMYVTMFFLQEKNDLHLTFSDKKKLNMSKIVFDSYVIMTTKT